MSFLSFRRSVRRAVPRRAVVGDNCSLQATIKRRRRGVGEQGGKGGRKKGRDSILGGAAAAEHWKQATIHPAPSQPSSQGSDRGKEAAPQEEARRRRRTFADETC